MNLNYRSCRTSIPKKRRGKHTHVMLVSSYITPIGFQLLNDGNNWLVILYFRFLSLDADMSVNIDGHGQQLAEEAIHSPPHPDIFADQQHQV